MDAYNAFGCIQEVFEAESLSDKQIREAELETALDLDDTAFSWGVPPPEPEGGKGKSNGGCEGKKAKDPKKDKKGKKRPESCGTDATVSSSLPGSSQVSISQEPEKSEKVFKIKKTSLKIPKGRVVAIVGRVCSGKSSLLQGLIGEMKESGSVKFSGSVFYCPKNTWIQVRSPTPYCIIRNPLNQLLECYHPRKHLLQSSTFRFG